MNCANAAPLGPLFSSAVSGKAYYFSNVFSGYTGKITWLAQSISATNPKESVEISQTCYSPSLDYKIINTYTSDNYQKPVIQATLNICPKTSKVHDESQVRSSPASS
jgi:hypothetical protein